MELPFEVGALYSRKEDIHALFGGQRQGGISTPKNEPVIIAFTGEAGASHGYTDFWDDEGIFHYYGEGQIGPMRYVAGNRAIRDHVKGGKELLVFQIMGKGKPCRYRGRFVALSSYIKPDTVDTRGDLRDAIVFRLQPLEDQEPFGLFEEESILVDAGLDETVAKRLVDVRTKQTLFRRRLLGVEKECRLTRIRDLRFLRASHIKPWAECDTADERTDGSNGLLLAPHADLLFDRGWMSFRDNGQLLVADKFPTDVANKFGLTLKKDRPCGIFTTEQKSYLNYHRDVVFEKRLSKKD